jgi:NitT/TauT family transport system permease protein
VVNTATGLMNADQDLVDLVTGLNGSRWKMLVKVRMPNALPYLFTGMRVSIVLSVIGAVVGEFVASTRGLGYLIFTGAANMEISLVFAAVALLAVIGNILYRGVVGLQWLVMPWERSRDGLKI